MRSWLFVPGDSARKLEKGFASDADVIIVDLEDSVAQDNKADARRIAIDVLGDTATRGGKPFYIRINPFASESLDLDLAVVAETRPQGVVLPKAGGMPSVHRLSARLRVIEAQKNLVDRSIRVLPIVTETAVGTLSVPSFVRGHQRLVGMTWGAEDLVAELGARDNRGPDGMHTDVFRLARANTLLAASATTGMAIDTVFVDFRNEAGLRSECVAAERDGFVGKLAIHPAQVEIINAVFTPSLDLVEEARAIRAAFTDAGNPGVIGIGGKMYDRPHLERAKRLLKRAADLGLPV